MQLAADGACAFVRIAWPEQHGLRSIRPGFDIRSIDAGIGQHMPRLVTGDDRGGHGAEQFAAFGKDKFNHCRIAVGLLRDAARLFRNVHGPKANEPPLGLGNDLLRHDAYIVVTQPLTGAIKRGRKFPCNGHTGPEQGQTRDGIDGNFSQLPLSPG